MPGDFTVTSIADNHYVLTVYLRTFLVQVEKYHGTFLNGINKRSVIARLIIVRAAMDHVWPP